MASVASVASHSVWHGLSYLLVMAAVVAYGR
jgi:hypothetical protein